MQLKEVLLTITRLTIYLSALVIPLTLLVILMGVNPGLFSSERQQSWKLPSITHDLPAGKHGKLIKYGHLLATETHQWMGPQVKNPAHRFAGNNLTCSNCHLQGGTKKGAISWIGVPQRFPQFRARENKTVTVEDRINGCMERSMNGRKLPEDSKQMEALVAYMEWISNDLPEDSLFAYQGMTPIRIPTVAADTVKGKAIYEESCTVCHGSNGEGVWNADQTAYQFPPLWGNDSYNHGAGMHRVITAATFIKGNMPWGQANWDNPVLSDEEALNVAAYINSFERPLKDDTDNDFPNLKLKPVSTPYGPWQDPFSASQHKYGPFLPIISHYQERYKIHKTK